jgi:L-rhamnose-H+ transport protein
MGTTQMGRYDFVSWSLHMSFIIMFSNIWGIIRKEWKAVRKATVNIMLSGILILLISTMIIGYGNSVSGKLVVFFMSVVFS